MSYNIVHCSIDENGKGRCGKAGDQTGRETCIRSLYNKNWDMCIRYKDSKVAAKAAEIGKKLANSNLVGYDKNQRNTLYRQLELNNWDVDKYIKSGVFSEADCSSFMYAIWCCLLPELRGQTNAPTTSLAKYFYIKHGFNVYIDSKYLVSGNNNKKGDMLNKAACHIVMCIDDGINVKKSKNIKTCKTNEDIAREVINGKWGNGQYRAKRLTDAGYDYKSIQSLVNKILKG